MAQASARLARSICETGFPHQVASGGGNDVGGEPVNNWVKLLCQIKTVLGDQIPRHPDQGHRSWSHRFSSHRRGKEVFSLGQDEDDNEFWHDLDSGYAGRERSDLRFFSVASGRKADNLEAAQALPVRGRDRVHSNETAIERTFFACHADIRRKKKVRYETRITCPARHRTTQASGQRL